MSIFNIFKKAKDIAIDLGPERTVVVHNGEVVIDEPTVVAMKGESMIEVGTEAASIEANAPSDIRVVRPLSNGVIYDFNATESLVRGFLEKAFGKCGFWGQKFNMMLVVPTDITQVEICAIKDIAKHCGSRKTYMVFRPLATAVGLDIDVQSPAGKAILDIGASTTDLTTISLGGIVESRTLLISTDSNISLKKVGNAIIEMLDQTPEELRHDIVEDGIYLIGDEPLKIAQCLPENYQVKFNVSKERGPIAAMGAYKVLSDINMYNFVLK